MINRAEPARQEVANDAVSLFEHYLPEVWAIVGSNARYRKKVLEAYLHRYDLVVNTLRRNASFSAKATIFDLIWEASNNGEPTRTYLQFMNEKVGSFRSLLQSQHNSAFRQLCLDMVLKHSDTGSEYKNHFSEIAVGEMLSRHQFELVQIEYELTNRRKIDFAFKKESSTFLVEVYNIDFASDLIDSSRGLRDFLETRLEKKLNEKLAGADIAEHTQVALVPVLWGTTSALEPYQSALKEFDQYGIITPFMVFSQYRATDGRYQYMFQTAAEYLDNWRSFRVAK